MKKEDLRIVFMGTPEFAVGTLSRLVDDGYNIVAVVTQPDKPVGRHQDHLQPSEVKQYALAHDIPVLQPVKMKDPAFVQQLASYKADLQVVVAFRMLPEVVWSMPRFGTFNVHAALLPQYRGAAPINWAIINGETETGVTTFFLDQQIDTGRIILQKHFPIPDDADVEYVYDGLMALGADIAEETINLVLENDGEGYRPKYAHRRQRGGATSGSQDLQRDLRHQLEPTGQARARLRARTVALPWCVDNATGQRHRQIVGAEDFQDHTAQRAYRNGPDRYHQGR